MTAGMLRKIAVLPSPAELAAAQQISGDEIGGKGISV
jgi:hypothetical protein